MEDDIEDGSSPSAYDKLRHMLAELKTGNIPELPQIRTRLELINQIFTEHLKSVGVQPSPPFHVPPTEVPLVEYLQRMGVSDRMIDIVASAIFDKTMSEEELHDILETALETVPRISPVNLHSTNDVLVEIDWSLQFQSLIPIIIRAKNLGLWQEYWILETRHNAFRLFARFLVNCKVTTEEVNSILTGLVLRNATAKKELLKVVKSRGVDEHVVECILHLLELT